MVDYNLKIRLTANGTTTTLDPVTGTPASVELSNLSSDTNYEVEVILQCDGGNTDIASDTETFRTSTAVDVNTPFYLENLTNDRATFTLTKNGTPASTDLSYSLDGDSWTMFDLAATTNTVEVPANGCIYLRSSTGFSNSTSDYFSLGMSERFSACGNIMNLFKYNKLDADLDAFCFKGVFFRSEFLVDASSLILPATQLHSNCYSNMFALCTSLTTAPELPATKLDTECYQAMFNGCTSLTTAPELPATTLKDSCYAYMFYGCTSLTTAPELPATTLKSNCYDSMFLGCTSLTSAPELPATKLDTECYQAMFWSCTSLTTAPELPATTLKDSCYAYMFLDCTSLTTAPELPATTLNKYCYGYMFQNCTNLTTAPELPATTLAGNCYADMFQGCTSLKTAPELPATTLDSYCYTSMFYGCTSLQSVTTYATTWNTSYTTDWLQNAGTNATNPTIYCPANSTIKNYTDNNSGIPTGWTQVDL